MVRLLKEWQNIKLRKPLKLQRKMLLLKLLRELMPVKSGMDSMRNLKSLSLPMVNSSSQCGNKMPLSLLQEQLPQ